MLWYYSLHKRWVIGFEDKLETTEQKMGKQEGFKECFIMSEITEFNFPNKKKLQWNYKVANEWCPISNESSSDLEIKGMFCRNIFMFINFSLLILHSN